MADVRTPRSVGCDEAGVLNKRGLAMIAFRLLRSSIVDGGRSVPVNSFSVNRDRNDIAVNGEWSHFYLDIY